jgi:hypothetical protein
MSDCYIGKEPFETMCCCNCRHYVKVCPAYYDTQVWLNDVGDELITGRHITIGDHYPNRQR